MSAGPAPYSVTFRVQSPKARGEAAVIHIAFASDVPAAELAPRLARIVDEHLAAPGNKSRLRKDGSGKPAVKSPGLY